MSVESLFAAGVYENEITEKHLSVNVGIKARTEGFSMYGAYCAPLVTATAHKGKAFWKFQLKPLTSDLE